MMRKLLLAGIALAAFVTGPAMAADLPVKAPPMVAAVAPFNWSRCYVGVHGGYGWGRNTNSFGNAVASGVTEEGSFFPAEFGPFDHNTSGPIVGGQVGCNYQFTPNWLVGIEGELWWSGIKGGFTAPEDSADPGQFSRFESRNLWDADIAMRLGWVAGRNLFYVKAGAAWGNFRYDETHDDFGTSLFHGCTPQCTVTLSKTVPGLLLGAGWEFAPPFWTFLTVKLEYNFINYAAFNLAYPSPGATIQNFPVHDTKHIVKVGVNFYFPP
jgi:outer membrane immunogenic protein